MKRALVLPSLCFAFLAGSFVGSSIGAQSAFDYLRATLGPFGVLVHAGDVFSLIVPPAMKAAFVAVLLVALIFGAIRTAPGLFRSASRASGHVGTSGRD